MMSLKKNGGPTQHTMKLMYSKMSLLTAPPPLSRLMRVNGTILPICYVIMGLQFQIVLTRISRNTNIQEIRERVKITYKRDN